MILYLLGFLVPLLAASNFIFSAKPVLSSLAVGLICTVGAAMIIGLLVKSSIDNSNGKSGLALALEWLGIVILTLGLIVVEIVSIFQPKISADIWAIVSLVGLIIYCFDLAFKDRPGRDSEAYES